MKKLKSKIKYRSIAIFAIVSAFSFAGCEKELKLNEPGNLVPKTVDQDLSLPAISVNNTKLHSEAFGNPADPMVVVLHGGPGGDYRSLLNCKGLADNGYYVVFYDQRGSGLSQRHDKTSYSIQVMLDDLSAVISHYRTSSEQKVFLFGHSWGAILATAYINTYPGAVKGVILAEPGGFNYDDAKGYISRLRKLEYFDEHTNDALYPDQFITGKEDEHQILDYKYSLQAVEGFAAAGDVAMNPFWRYGAITESSLLETAEREGFDFTANLHQFQTKVLFLYSEHNPAYGYDHALRVSSAYTNVQLNEIKGSGHEMIYFAWNNVYPLTLTYLNSLK